MVSIPYWLGKKLGSQAVQYILHRFAKSAMLHDLRGGSDFFFVLIVRLLGILSADVVSGYMGAVGVRYKEYLLIAASIQLAEMLISCVTLHFYRRKHAAHENKIP